MADLTVEDVRLYLGDAANRLTDEELTDVLDAETAAQAARCRIPDVYPSDLGEALKRRVARNLAMRAIPLAVLQGDQEFGSTVPPGQDPEVRRLEAPWRRLAVG